MSNHLDNEQIAEDYRLLRKQCGQLLIAKPALISLQGSDRREWLQGQATNDIRKLTPQNPVSFCLCTATGQLECIVDAWERENDILLSCAMETRQILLDRIENMVIMEDVIGEDLTDSYDFTCIQGPESILVEESICLPNDRSGFGGFDIWTAKTQTSPSAKVIVPLVAKEALEAARIEAGIPLFGADTTEKTLPPELGLRFESAHVSYDKGCYTGQEILQRLHSRGHTNKVWVGFVADGELERGAVIDAPDRAGIGSVSSMARSPRLGSIGAGTVRNEFSEPGTRLRVQTERGEVEIEVREFPF